MTQANTLLTFTETQTDFDFLMEDGINETNDPIPEDGGAGKASEDQWEEKTAR